MIRDEVSHEPCPAGDAQYLSEDREAGQKNTLDVFINKSPVNLHAPSFDAAGARICLRVSDIGGKSVLKALKFRKWHRHDHDGYSELESGLFAELHALVHQAEEC